jgi:hypothetical protein
VESSVRRVSTVRIRSPRASPPSPARTSMVVTRHWPSLRRRSGRRGDRRGDLPHPVKTPSRRPSPSWRPQ